MQAWHFVAMLVLLGIGYALYVRSTAATRTTSTAPQGSSNNLLTSLLSLGVGIYDKVSAPSATTQATRDTAALNFNDDHSPPAKFGVTENADGSESWYVTD